MDIKQRYNILTHLPLFQGISGKTLLHLEEKVRMDFVSWSPRNGVFVKQGDYARRLAFVVEGTFTRIMSHHDPDYDFEENLIAPYVIEPESLFGLNPIYRASYKPTGVCTIMLVSKQDFIQVLMKEEVFRLNILNYLSASIHHSWDAILQKPAHNAQEKIIQLIQKLSTTNCGEKCLRIKMTGLSELTEETRLSISNALNNLHASGKVVLKRKEISIPNINALLE